MRDKKKRRGRGDSAREQELFWSEIQDEAERIQQEMVAAEDSASVTPDYKSSQLSAQAEDAIVLALASSNDPALRDLNVSVVTPVRGSSCLEVVVHPVEPTADLGWLETKLKRAKGYLRGELAASIHRKRTPDLVFVVLPAEDGNRPWDSRGEEVDDDER